MNKSAFLFLLTSALTAHAGVYKWTDAQGHTHYSDSPPPTAKASQLKLQSYSGPAQVSQTASQGSGVTLYTTSWCGVCKRAKAFLKEKGIPFSEWDVETSDYASTKFRQLGGSGVPLITVGSQVMKGFDSSRFMEMWQASKTTP
jgi:glutaredoxin